MTQHLPTRLIPMAETRALTYRCLWQSWWHVPLVLTVGIAVTVHAIILYVSGLQCHGCALTTGEALSATLTISLIIGLLGLAFGVGRNSGAKALVGQAFNVAYLGENHDLTRRVHGLSDRLGLPRPSVGIMSTANAFAVGASPEDGAVILGRPLINVLTSEELDAVIGHELGHIATGDMQKMQIATGYQSLFDVVFQAIGVVLQVGLMIAAAINSRNARDAQAGLGIAYGLATLGRVTIAVGSELMVKGMSRSREYYADAVGAHLTSPEAMETALVKIHELGSHVGDEERRFGALMFRSAASGHMFSTHPTLGARQRALRRGDYVARIERRVEAVPVATQLKAGGEKVLAFGAVAAPVAGRGAVQGFAMLMNPRLLKALAALGLLAGGSYAVIAASQAVQQIDLASLWRTAAPAPSLNAMGPWRTTEAPNRTRKRARLAQKVRSGKTGGPAILTRQNRLTIARKGKAPTVKGGEG